MLKKVNGTSTINLMIMDNLAKQVNEAKEIIEALYYIIPASMADCAKEPMERARKFIKECGEIKQLEFDFTEPATEKTKKKSEMKKYYKGIYICVQTPIYRIFEVDHRKHSGIFKYCDFKITSFVHKGGCWCMKKDLRDNAKLKK